MNLQEMIARQRELTEAARQQGRSLTAEEQREFDSLQEQIDSMTASGEEGQRGVNPSAEILQHLEKLHRAVVRHGLRPWQNARGFGILQIYARDLVWTQSHIFPMTALWIR